MAEWWNVDQALIWMLGQDADLVALAAGDAKGAAQRRTVYLDHLEFSDAAEGDDEGTGEAPIASLMIFLRNGRFEARDVGQSPPVPVDEALFNEHVCVVNERHNDVMSLRTVTWPFVWLPIVINADTVRRYFPGRAPADMQTDLAGLYGRLSTHVAPSSTQEATEPPTVEPASPLERPTVARVGRKRALAIQALKKEYPNGLPDPMQGHGDKAAAARNLAKKIMRDNPGVSINESTILKAADAMQKAGK